MPLRPIIFLDFDDVLVLNRPGEFGGYDVLAPSPPPELWSRVFHSTSVRTLVEAIEEHGAEVVITSSWLLFMEREAFEHLFAKAGLGIVSERMHDAWEA